MPPRPPVPYEQLQRALQTDLPSVTFAAIALATGLAAIVLSRLRSRDPLLRWMGIFAALYGLRLYLGTDLVRIAAGIDRQIIRQAVGAITYAIPIPYALFCRELFGRGWKRAIAAWVWVQVAFAPLAIAADMVGGY